MQRWLCAALVASAPACNQVYGVEETGLVDAAPDADLRPDRDGDGIADIEDPCIASERDGSDDSDHDGPANNLDDCPFVPGASGDTDADGVGNRCDPFETNAGDAITCTMRFFDPVLTASLWTPREGEQGLAVGSGYLIGFAQAAPAPVTSFVAMERIAPATGTIYLEIPFATLAPQGFGFRVWVSAGPVPSADDVACDFYANPSEIVVTPVGATVIGTDPGPGYAGEGNMQVRVIMQPEKSGTNLVCAVIYGSNTAVAAAHFDGALGMQGVAVISGAVAVNGILIEHRGDQPDLL